MWIIFFSSFFFFAVTCRSPIAKTHLLCRFVKCCWRCDATGWAWSRRQISCASPTLLSLKVPSTSDGMEICPCRYVPLPRHESDDFTRHRPFTWRTRATSATWHERHSVKTGRRCLCTHSRFFLRRIRGESSPTRKTTLPSSPLLLLLYLHPENRTTAKLSQRFPPKILRPSSLWRSAVWGEYQPHVSQDCTSAGCHSLHYFKKG